MHDLAPIPLSQPHPPRVDIRHGPSLITILRNPKPQHQFLLTNQLIQIQQRRLIAPRRRQLKRTHQTPRQRLDAVPRRRIPQVLRVHPVHVDLALAFGEVGGLRLEVELEAEGAGAVAGEAGEGDDEVLVVGVAGVLGDLEREGDVGGARGLRAVSGAAGGDMPAARGAICRVADVLKCEIYGDVGVGGVDLVGGGRLEGGAAVCVGALLGGGER